MSRGFASEPSLVLFGDLGQVTNTLLSVLSTVVNSLGSLNQMALVQSPALPRYQLCGLYLIVQLYKVGA